MSLNQLETGAQNLQLNDSKYMGNGFHYNWIDIDKLTIPYATSVVQGVKLDLEIELNNEAEVLQRLRYNGIETISDFASCTFLNKFSGDFQQAKQDLEKVQELMRRAKEKNLIEIDYLEGISFVLKLLTNYIYKDPQQSGTKTFPDPDYSQEYNALRAKSLAAILAMKLYFITRLPPKLWNSESDKALATRIIKLDPKNAEWYICLYKQIWYQYRDPGSSEKKYYNELKSTIENAMKCENATNNPNVLLYFCECLIELGRKMRKGSISGVWQEHVELANQNFSNFEELTSYVVTTYRRVIKLNPSVYAYTKIALGLFTRLREENDLSASSEEHVLKLAKEYLDNALKLCPSSSNANHKRGLYALIIENNVEGAIEHFRESFASNPNHFGALVDLILTLMSEPDKNQDEILGSINKHITEASPWSRRQKGELIRIKGYLLFMQGNVERAINCWIEGKRYDNKWDFGALPIRLQRYKWPDTKISVASVKVPIDHLLKLYPTDISLKKMSAKLFQVI